MTGRDWRRAGHTVWRPEALATSLATLLVAMVDQLGTAVRINTPEGTLSGLVLGAGHLDEIPAESRLCN